MPYSLHSSSSSRQVSLGKPRSRHRVDPPNGIPIPRPGKVAPKRPGAHRPIVVVDLNGLGSVAVVEVQRRDE